MSRQKLSIPNESLPDYLYQVGKYVEALESYTWRLQKVLRAIDENDLLRQTENSMVRDNAMVELKRALELEKPQPPYIEFEIVTN